MDESTLEDLLEDEPTAAGAAAVLARAEATDGTVTWSEVSDVVDAPVWGRLLAADVLVEVGEAFVIDDPTALEGWLEAQGYDISADAAATNDGQDGWRSIDKAAGVGALVLATGYQVSAIETPVVTAMDAALGPVAAVVPFPILVLGLAAGTATLSTVLRRRLVDREAIKRQKDRAKQVKDRLRDARDRNDDTAVDRLEAEQWDLAKGQLGTLTRSLRPMVWTMLVTIPVFLWLSWLVVSPSTAIAHATPLIPAIDRIVWSTRVLGPMRLWMVWYVVCQLTSTLAIRRGLDRLPDRNVVPI